MLDVTGSATVAYQESVGWKLQKKIMKQEMRRRWSLKRNRKAFALVCFTAPIAFGLPAHGQQASQNNEHAVVDRSWKVAAASPQCPRVQHWDPDMGMCMPDEKSTEKTTVPAPSKHSETTATSPTPAVAPPLPPAPASCPSGDTWDVSMQMCMRGAAKPKTTVMFHLNQFMVFSNTSGPRGISRLTGPGMWMLMYDNDITPKNHLHIDVMGSPEQLTVGDRGTPQLLQTENIDAMHPHDTIMALEFRDVITLGADDQQKLTFLFAPRGEAAIGPVPFMHRESAEGNPDAPLAHNLQDGFHDVSTVLGGEYQFARTTLEATAFSGKDLSWPLPLHSPDSYGLRVNQEIDDHIDVGASYADALLPDGNGGAEHNRFLSAWLTTSHRIGDDTLKSSFIWGQARASHSASLNSFLEEAVYQSGKNKFFGRAEALQIMPDQLGLTIAGAADSRWVQAVTFGYERTLFEKDDFSLFAGGSYTKDFVPGAFKPAYGSDPRGVKAYLRMTFMMASSPGF